MSKINIFTFANRHCVFKKIFLLFILEMFAFFFSIGQLWSWQLALRGRPETEKSSQADSELPVLVRAVPLLITLGLWLFFLQSSQWSFELWDSVQKTTFFTTVSTIVQKKLQQLCHTMGVRIQSKVYQQSETID